MLYLVHVHYLRITSLCMPVQPPPPIQRDWYKLIGFPAWLRPPIFLEANNVVLDVCCAPILYYSGPPPSLPFVSLLFVSPDHLALISVVIGAFTSVNFCTSFKLSVEISHVSRCIQQVDANVELLMFPSQ